MRKFYFALIVVLCFCPSAFAVVGAYDHREYVNWDDYPNIVQFRTTRGGYCTAQYVGIDLILTAAHCVVGADEHKYKIINNKGESFYAYLETKGGYAGEEDFGKGEDWALLRIRDYRGFRLRNFYRWKVLKDDAPVSNIGFGGLRVLSTPEIELLKNEIRKGGCTDGIRRCLEQYDNVMVTNGYEKISPSDVKNLKADKNCYVLVNTDCSKLCNTNKKLCETKCRSLPIPKGRLEFATACDTWGGNSGGPFVDKDEGKVVSVASNSNYGTNFGKNFGSYTTPAKQFRTIITNAREQSPTIDKIKSYNGKNCNESYLPKYATSGQYVVTNDNFYCYATECEDGKYLAVKKNTQGKWLSRGFCVTDEYCQQGKKLNILNGKWTDLQCVTEQTRFNIIPQSVGIKQPESDVSEDIELKQSFISIDEPPEEIKTDEIDIQQLEAMLKTLQENVDTGMQNISTQSDENILSILSSMVEYNELDELRKKYEEAKAREQSFSNRALTAATVAATGLGGMQMASAIAEQRSDQDAERDMSAYVATMKCEYGDGQQIRIGNEEITLPGGNELLGYYNEYREIAERLKQTKTALGLRSGIESEVLYDRAQTGLYQYANIGKTGGGETSLYRALTDETGTDAARWNEQKEGTAKKKNSGTSVAGTGAIGGAVGNMIINKDQYFEDKNQGGK